MLALDLARGVPRRELLRQLGGALAAGLIAEITGLFAMAPTRAIAATGAPSSPYSSSNTFACLGQAQDALADVLAGCYPETLDRGSLAYWLAGDQCLANAPQSYQLDQAQCLGPEADCPEGRECSRDLRCPAGAVGCGAVCCATGQSCSSGQCSGGAGGGTGGTCAAGLTACSGACVNLQSDTQNCGSCGNACTRGQRCIHAQCTLTCSAGLTLCGGACVNLQRDASRCGACGRTCLAGQSRSGGICACLASLVVCGGVFVNLQSDPNNRGGYGRACGGG